MTATHLVLREKSYRFEGVPLFLQQIFVKLRLVFALQLILITLKCDKMIVWNWPQTFFVSWMFLAVLVGVTSAFGVLTISKLYSKFFEESIGVQQYECTFSHLCLTDIFWGFLAKVSFLLWISLVAAGFTFSLSSTIITFVQFQQGESPYSYFQHSIGASALVFLLMAIATRILKSFVLYLSPLG